MRDLNRYACFNELSFLDKEEDENLVELFEKYAKAIKALKEAGFRGVRYEYGITSLSKEGIRDLNALGNNPMGRIILSLIRTTARNPYLGEGSEEEERYIKEDFEVKIDNHWTASAYGITAAYLNDTITLSLDTAERWRQAEYEIKHTCETESNGTVLNVHSEHMVKNDLITQFIENRQELVLEICKIMPDKKKYSFRDDHGKDKLIELWKRLRNCEYIENAINSLPFNSTGKEFVEKCFPDGKIHIRLNYTDAGYGMVIQTTGRTLRETERIGILINENFS